MLKKYFEHLSCSTNVYFLTSHKSRQLSAKLLYGCRNTNEVCSQTQYFCLISCTLHFGFNYEINYQLDAIEYLFALSSFSSTCFGLTRPSSEAIGVTISYKCSIWCPWFLPGQVSTPPAHTLLKTDT